MVFKQYNTFLTPIVQGKEDILIDVFFSYRGTETILGMRGHSGNLFKVIL
ncbi:hypothetical protein B4083_1412 [Bacillus cereus]|nr:hypothetical protein B4083_1412 [Bacillus cereus]